MFTWLARIILRNRGMFLILLGLITAFMAYKARDIQLSYEYAPLLPPKDSASVEFENFKKLFGKGGNILVIGIQDSNFLTLNKFNGWLDLGDSIKKVDGVTNIISITHAYNLTKNSKEKRFELTPIVTEKPTNQKDLDEIASTIKSLPFYKGELYNDETNCYLMAITLDRTKLLSAKREKLIDNIEKIAVRFEKDFNSNLYLSGLPYVRIKTARKIERELYMFIMLAILITAIILYLFLRSFKAVLFSICIVAIGVIWVFGTIVLFNYRITTLTAVIPPLLIVIGIPNCVFLLNKYHFEFRNHGNKVRALQRVIQKIGNAIFLTNLTTAAGFATFTITSTKILREFGVVASINIMAIFVLSILLIPITYSFLAPPCKRHTKHFDNKNIKKFTDFLIDIALNHRKKIYIGTITLVLFGFFGIALIKSTGYMVDDIPHHDPVYVDLLFFEDNFNGLMPLEIMVDAKVKKGVLKYTTIKKIEALQKKLASYPELSRPFSITEAAKFARQAYFNGSESNYKLPSKMEQNFILSYFRNETNKLSILNSFIDSTQQITRISYRMKDVGTIKLKIIEDSILTDIASIFPSDKYKVIVTGSSIILSKGFKYLNNSLFTSLFLAITLISFFMAWMFASWRMVLYSLIPNLIPLLITAAFMGYANIPIKPSTVLVFSIAFGISVDYSIHFLAKYRQELKSNNLNIKKSVIFAIRETGISLVYSSVVLFFGFGIFALSGFGGTVTLGILVSMTLLIAVMCNLILLPSLLLSLNKVIKNRSFEEPLLQIFEEEEDIELEELKIVNDCVESHKILEN